MTELLLETEPNTSERTYLVEQFINEFVDRYPSEELDDYPEMITDVSAYADLFISTYKTVVYDALTMIRIVLFEWHNDCELKYELRGKWDVTITAVIDFKYQSYDTVGSIHNAMNEFMDILDEEEV